MRVTSESAEWICLATNLGLEMLSAACDQASSPRRPHFALFGMLLAIAAVLISIGELIYKGKKERVVLRRWGMLWWFYHPPPRRHKPFGTLPDTYGLVAGISQCIFSIVQYVYCLRHADNPFKASLLPAIFLICLGGSRLSNKRMNANTTDNMDSWENSSSTEETSLHPISEYYAPANIPFLNNHEVEVEGNIEHEQRELVQGMVQERELVRERLEREQLEREQELVQERELVRERLKREQVQEMMQEKEREQERERLVWEWLVRERERERLVRGREQELWERERDRELWERKREREREQEQEQERLELEQEQWQKQLQQTQLWQEQKQKQQEQLPKRQKQQKLRQRRVVKAD